MDYITSIRTYEPEPEFWVVTSFKIANCVQVHPDDVAVVYLYSSAYPRLALRIHDSGLELHDHGLNIQIYNFSQASALQSSLHILQPHYSILHS